MGPASSPVRFGDGFQRAQAPHSSKQLLDTDTTFRGWQVVGQPQCTATSDGALQLKCGATSSSNSTNGVTTTTAVTSIFAEPLSLVLSGVQQKTPAASVAAVFGELTLLVSTRRAAVVSTASPSKTIVFAELSDTSCAAHGVTATMHANTANCSVEIQCTSKAPKSPPLWNAQGVPHGVNCVDVISPSYDCGASSLVCCFWFPAKAISVPLSRPVSVLCVIVFGGGVRSYGPFNHRILSFRGARSTAHKSGCRQRSAATQRVSTSATSVAERDHRRSRFPLARPRCVSTQLATCHRSCFHVTYVVDAQASRSQERVKGLSTSACHHFRQIRVGNTTPRLRFKPRLTTLERIIRSYESTRKNHRSPWLKLLKSLLLLSDNGRSSFQRVSILSARRLLCVLCPVRCPRVMFRAH